MSTTKAYPVSFSERFPSPELQAEAVSNNHAAPISSWCSNCGGSLGYLHYMGNTDDEICPHCGAVVKWDEKERA